MATLTVNGVIYCIGGHDASVLMKKVEAYDPYTDSWTAKADMPTARTYVGAAAVGSVIYVIGG